MERIHRILCLGAACTGCILIPPPYDRSSPPLSRRCLHGVHRRQKRWCAAQISLPRRCLHGVHPQCHTLAGCSVTLPRRCLHGVHRHKPTNCGTPFCSIRRESVDSFSEINNKDSCADYFPALFCCQGDLHHHYRQPRTGNRPVLRCEQHRLFCSYYLRTIEDFFEFPCWRVFLALWISAVSRDGGIAQTVGNLAEAVQN